MAARRRTRRASCVSPPMSRRDCCAPKAARSKRSPSPNAASPTDPNSASLTDGIKSCLLEALEAALGLDDLSKAEELLADARHPPSRASSPPPSRPSAPASTPASTPAAATMRTSSATTGPPRQIFAEHGLVFHHAATQTEHAEWLAEPRTPRRRATPVRAGARNLRTPRSHALARTARSSPGRLARQDPRLTQALRHFVTAS